MATKDEIVSVLTILSGAHLRGAPGNDETPLVAKTWIRIMADIPGRALTRAVEDHIMVNEFWPTPAAIRKAAAQVITHNYGSAAPNPFKDDSSARAPYKGIARVTAGGWQSVDRESLHPKPLYSPEVMEAIAALEAKYYDTGLPTDAELAEIDRLTAGVL